MNERVIIERRFRGPPDSGHGGYVSGVVAGLLDGTAEVTLRKPVPLDRPMDVERPETGRVAVRDGDTLIAEAVAADLEIATPAPPTLKEAEDAARRSIGFDDNPFPACFCCGHERKTGDGLRIFPGPLDRTGMVAAPWVPHASLGGGDGTVKNAYLWAALDCPSGWAVIRKDNPRVLLGRFAVRVDGNPPCGAPCVVVAWPVAADGRKLHSGSAIFSETGELWAAAKATWIKF